MVHIQVGRNLTFTYGYQKQCLKNKVSLYYTLSSLYTINYYNFYLFPWSHDWDPLGPLQGKKKLYPPKKGNTTIFPNFSLPLPSIFLKLFCSYSITKSTLTLSLNVNVSRLGKRGYFLLYRYCSVSKPWSHPWFLSLSHISKTFGFRWSVRFYRNPSSAHPNLNYLLLSPRLL